MAVAHTPKYATDGIASITVAPIGILSGSTAWSEEFYTLKDSISFAMPEAARNSIMVDQLDVPVYTTFDNETLTVSGTIPDVSKDLLEYIYETTTADPYAPGDVEGTPSATHTATGVKLSINTINAMFKITFVSGVSVIITNGTFIANWTGDSLSTNALGHNFSTTAKAGLGGVAGESADIVMWTPN